MAAAVVRGADGHLGIDVAIIKGELHTGILGHLRIAVFVQRLPIVIRAVEALQRPGAECDFIGRCAARAGEFAFRKRDAELLCLFLGHAKDGSIHHVPAALDHAIGLDERHDGLYAFDLLELRNRFFIQFLLA
ncbi:hypothetical protein SDC9_196167 [bioreactor metagenome]|uniref:Uncharacterized protein n=1 Tax=bioreactor metagenome TaxID=1076179 RepID=A0A645IB55_9ZZZZ